MDNLQKLKVMVTQRTHGTRLDTPLCTLCNHSRTVLVVLWLVSDVSSEGSLVSAVSKFLLLKRAHLPALMAALIENRARAVARLIGMEHVPMICTDKQSLDLLCG